MGENERKAEVKENNSTTERTELFVYQPESAGRPQGHLSVHYTLRRCHS